MRDEIDIDRCLDIDIATSKEVAIIEDARRECDLCGGGHVSNPGVPSGTSIRFSDKLVLAMDGRCPSPRCDRVRIGDEGFPHARVS